MSESRYDEPPKVSVIVPSILRDKLSRAVASVASQDYPRESIEIVLVVDKPDGSLIESSVEAEADLVLYTGGGKGATFARQLGVSESAGDLIAFLDDDDAWAASKLRAQVEAVRTVEATYVVAACRFREVGSSGKASPPVPSRLIEEGQRVEDYLFRGRGPTVGRASIPTSTILTTRRTALAVPWDTTLRRHQDWDWLVRACRLDGMTMLQLEDELVAKSMGSPASISSTSDWRTSLEWALRWRDAWSPTTFTDFVAGQVLRYAFQSRSLRGVAECLRLMRQARRAPSLNALALGLTGLAPRRIAERVFAGISTMLTALRTGRRTS